MKRFAATLFAITIAILSTGCSTVAPQYTASIENVQSLKDAGSYTAKIGVFTSNPGKANANPISLRASSMSSPYEGSYANYIAASLKQELSLAKTFALDSTIEISGILLKNDVDISGFSTGAADIEARFIVKRSGEVRYDAVKSAHNEFPSSFAGGVAIPRAVQEYPIVVQKLLAALYADKAFITALK